MDLPFVVAAAIFGMGLWGWFVFAVMLMIMFVSTATIESGWALFLTFVVGLVLINLIEGYNAFTFLLQNPVAILGWLVFYVLFGAIIWAPIKIKQKARNMRRKAEKHTEHFKPSSDAEIEEYIEDHTYNWRKNYNDVAFYVFGWSISLPVTLLRDSIEEIWIKVKEICGGFYDRIVNGEREKLRAHLRSNNS